MEANFICAIPAREKSKRFPGKIIYKINEIPLIIYVIKSCLRSSAKKVIVATDSQNVKKVISEYIPTHPKLAIKIIKGRNIKTGTDRVAELVKRIKIKNNEIIVNVQGDEPLMSPEIINKVASELKKDKKADISTYGFITQNRAEIENPNRVKIVIDRNSYALYFSRNPIPYGSRKYLIHTGIYAFRKKSLLKFTSLETSKNEISEKLEQLRALDNSMKIKVVVGEKRTHPVDTEDDIKEVLKLIRKKKKLRKNK